MIVRPWRYPVLNFLVWGGLLLGGFIHAHAYPAVHTVYGVYAAAARNWWAGHDIYVRTIDYFRYSPLAAIAFSPFAWLPDSWGCPLWKVANGLFFVFALFFWARHALPACLTTKHLCLLFLLVLPLILHSLYIGQANLIMVGALMLGMATAARERWNKAAGWVAVATLIKAYPLVLGLLLLALFPRRFGPRYLLALLAGLGLPFLAQRPGFVVEQ